jgi:Mrp family chromosome partitioning ATPase
VNVPFQRRQPFQEPPPGSEHPIEDGERVSANRSVTAYSYSSRPPPRHAPPASGGTADQTRRTTKKPALHPVREWQSQHAQTSSTWIVRAVTAFDPDPRVLASEGLDRLLSRAGDAASGGVIAMTAELPEHRATKSLAAGQLAHAIAESGLLVLVIEGDTDEPAVHHALRLEVPLTLGMSRQLRARIQDPKAPLAVLGCTVRLHALPEGAIRSPGILISAQFQDLVLRARSLYDVVVINGPSGLTSNETHALQAMADRIVVVD